MGNNRVAGGSPGAGSCSGSPWWAQLDDAAFAQPSGLDPLFCVLAGDTSLPHDRRKHREESCTGFRLQPIEELVETIIGVARLYPLRTENPCIPLGLAQVRDGL